MENKKYLIIPCILLGLMASFAIAGNLPVATTGGLSSSTGIGYNSKVVIEKNGQFVYESPNTFTTNGQNLTTDMLFANVGAAVDYIGLGNDTGANTTSINITHELEEFDCVGLGRKQATTNAHVSAPPSNGNRTLAVTFTNGCDATVLVNNTALFNATTSATDVMFAANNFTAVSLSSADQVTVTWYVWVA